MTDSDIHEVGFCWTLYFAACLKARYILYISGYQLKLDFQISCVFPVRSQIFPVTINMFCDYYIHKTDLADLSSFNFLGEIFTANIEISFTFRIREFTT